MRQIAVQMQNQRPQYNPRPFMNAPGMNESSNYIKRPKIELGPSCSKTQPNTSNNGSAGRLIGTSPSQLLGQAG